MATRSRIAKKNADGTITSIYCHWDGYPSYNGKILLEHYQDEKKIDELLSLGNLSSLAPEIGDKPHNFDNNPEGICNYYGRDRKEDNQDPVISYSDIGFKTLCVKSDAEWYYLYEDGVWKYSRGSATNLEFSELKLVD